MKESTAFSSRALAPETEALSCSRGTEERAWKHDLARAVRDPATLLERLRLPATCIPQARRAAERFPLLVPESFLARMRPGDPADPLLRQVLPLEEEEEDVAGFVADPLDEQRATVTPGLLQKYDGRALLVTTGTCAVHCRYCFRRHFPYGAVPKGMEAWEPALRAIAGDGSIDEVILSGGDPLVLTDRAIRSLVERLEQVPHLRRIRIHTRLPVVLPTRVTTELLDILTAARTTVVLVIHANHPAELVADCAAAISRLASRSILLFNQAVLLRAVNDDSATLTQLSKRLVDLHILPYYLHQLDAVAGAAHFSVPEERGRELLAELRAALPGYAVPRYVREEPGAPSKIEV